MREFGGSKGSGRESRRRPRTARWPRSWERTSRDIPSHGGRLQSFALDPTGTTLVTGDADGLVRVGPLSGEGEPHLLYGHGRAVTSVAVSRLGPMPEGPALHTLPYDALLAKLRSLTNLRVVPDVASATGYKLQPGPFPGWAKPPEW